ncbi:fibrous_sheath-interacting protein [Hexamita inflata]|uniref:Fibrous sheath-interacting protein n=1 Tax=Hexamita inflata TaxID=28002 RepID=A0AA86QR30_9EUKA|nr:fibrous sheath-interacting protein [Hexamita inflata]
MFCGRKMNILDFLDKSATFGNQKIAVHQIMNSACFQKLFLKCLQEPHRFGEAAKRLECQITCKVLNTIQTCFTQRKARPETDSFCEYITMQSVNQRYLEMEIHQTRVFLNITLRKAVVLTTSLCTIKMNCECNQQKKCCGGCACCDKCEGKPGCKCGCASCTCNEVKKCCGGCACCDKCEGKPGCKCGCASCTCNEVKKCCGGCK